MTRDEVAALVLIGSFATWGSLHVLLAWRLGRSAPWWHGLVALVLPPLAPYWGMRSGRRVMGSAWLVAGTVWLLARVFLSR